MLEMILANRSRIISDPLGCKPNISKYLFRSLRDIFRSDSISDWDSMPVVSLVKAYVKGIISFSNSPPYMGVPIDGMSEHEAALAAIEAIAQLIDDLDIPALGEATSMKIGNVDMVAEVASADGCNGLNPRPWTADLYAGALKKMLGMSNIAL